VSSSSLVARIYHDVLSLIFALSFFSRDETERSFMWVRSAWVSNVDRNTGAASRAAFRKLNQEHESWDLRAVYRLVEKRDD